MKFHIRLSSFVHALSLSAFALVMNHIHPLTAPDVKQICRSYITQRWLL